MGLLHRYPQLYSIIWRVHQILLGAKVSLGRLHGCVPQQQLDLLKLSAGSAAHFRATAPQVVRGDSGDSGGYGVRLK